MCTFVQNTCAQTLGLPGFLHLRSGLGRCVLRGNHHFEGLSSKGMTRTVNLVRSRLLRPCSSKRATKPEGVSMNTPYSRDALNSRLAERWSVHYRVQFAYAEYAGEGVTLDVSAGGLCIITNRVIAPGVEM